MSAFGSQLTSSNKFKNGTFHPVGYFSALLENGKDSSIPFRQLSKVMRYNNRRRKEQVFKDRKQFSRKRKRKLSSFMQTVEKKSCLVQISLCLDTYPNVQTRWASTWKRRKSRQRPPLRRRCDECRSSCTNADRQSSQIFLKKEKKQKQKQKQRDDVTCIHV